MASIKQTLALNDQMSKVLTNITKTMDTTLKMMKQVQGANFDKVFDDASKSAALARTQLDEFNESVNQIKSNTRQATSSATGLLTAIKGLATGYTMLKVAEQADTVANTRARLNLIAKEGESVDELTNKIYASANASRSSYQSTADIVAKLGMQAGDAFNNNNDEIIAFTELLNKQFTVGGLDTTAIESTMYNLTQSLSSGKLLGNDYRILKQNAASMVAIIRDYYGVTQQQLDDMVTAGKVSAADIKNAMFGAADSINDKFEQMPMTFSQAWTIFKNSALKAFEPVLQWLIKLLNSISKIFTFLSENQYIFYVVAGAVGALAIAYTVLNAKTIATTVAQWALNSAFLACPLTWVILLVSALVAVLIYLWNTNDDVAYGMMASWDYFTLGMQKVGITFKKIWYGILDVVDSVVSEMVQKFSTLIEFAVNALNSFYAGLNKLFGTEIEMIDMGTVTAATSAEEVARRKGARDAEIAEAYEEYYLNAGQLENNRLERVQNRSKIGTNKVDSILDSVLGTDSTGASAIKTTSNDKLLTDDDIKLLLDVATRDYKLNYQSMTPNVTLTFGDIRETADVDDIMDILADKLESIYDSDLEVVQ